MLKHLIYGNEPDRRDREQGSALIVTMVVIMMVSALVLVSSQMSINKSSDAVNESRYLQLSSAAESGMGAKFEAISQANSAPATVTEAMDLVVAGTPVAIRVVDLGSSAYEITSTATGGNGNRVEVVATITASIHPTFRKALYVGNKDGLPIPLRLGPVDSLTSTFTYDESATRYWNYELKESDVGIDFDGDGALDDEPHMWALRGSGYPDWGMAQGNMQDMGGYNYRIDLDQDGSYGTYTHTNVHAPEFAAPASTEVQDPSWYANFQGDGDYVDGEVHVNGDAEMRGNSLAFDKVEATGTVQGNNVPNNATGGAAPIDPPDLQATDYHALADTVVTTSDLSHPAFHSPLTGNDYGLLGTAGNMDNGVVHLGQTSGSETVAFSSSDNGDLLLVEGNLWIHNTHRKKLSLPSNSGLVMTIVVEGNLYIADDFNYNDANGDSAVLFLVKGKGDDPSTPEREDESYYDANKNLVYDAGDTIINDDGNGVYDGPKEGQGNVFFGDVKFGTGGVTDGYMYAENNAYLMDPAAATHPLADEDFEPDDKIYGVHGFLSAGGVVDLGVRSLETASNGKNYFQYKVKDDPRLRDQEINFKGLPTALGGGDDFTLLAWTSRRY